MSLGEKSLGVDATIDCFKLNTTKTAHLTFSNEVNESRKKTLEE